MTVFLTIYLALLIIIFTLLLFGASSVSPEEKPEDHAPPVQYMPLPDDSSNSYLEKNIGE